MSPKELREFKKFVKEYTKKITRNRSTALRHLIAAGFITPKTHKLRKKYR